MDRGCGAVFTALPQPSSGLITGGSSEPLRTSGINVSIRQFYGVTIEQFVDEALRYEPDLIIVGSHHHNFFYNLLVGSVTNDVLMRAKCPVLVVPA